MQMTSDEIMHVLRLTAMGRVAHPDQVEFCEIVEGLIEAKRRFEEALLAPLPTAAVSTGIDALIYKPAEAPAETEPVKRTRKTKAE
jgi:hypothetical protein